MELAPDAEEHPAPVDLFADGDSQLTGLTDPPDIPVPYVPQRPTFAGLGVAGTLAMSDSPGDRALAEVAGQSRFENAEAAVDTFEGLANFTVPGTIIVNGVRRRKTSNVIRRGGRRRLVEC